MIIGYTCGVYDLLHIGHINLLKNAKALCDRLIVGLTTDECVKYKSKNTVIDYESRKKIIESIVYVDCVVPQTDTDKIAAWDKLKYNILFVGDDWYGTEKWNTYEKKLKDKKVKVIYFPYTKSCSTTIIKKKIVNPSNVFMIFDLDKTLWNFYTNLIKEEDIDTVINNYVFSNDVVRIFNYLSVNSISFGFASRSKYPNRCKRLLNKIGINMDNHLNYIMWTEEKTKLEHVKAIVQNSNVSPEFIVLFDDDNENLESVKHIIGYTKLVDKNSGVTFEDFIDVLYSLN